MKPVIEGVSSAKVQGFAPRDLWVVFECDEDTTGVRLRAV